VFDVKRYKTFFAAVVVDWHKEVASTKLEQNGNQNPLTLNGSGNLHEVSSLSTILSEKYEQEESLKEESLWSQREEFFPSVTGCRTLSEERRS